MTAPILVFDGLCLLCSANARFVLKHDRAGIFRLASMQSEAGASLYRRFGIDPADPDTFLLVEEDRAYRDSEAAIRIFTRLGWPWRVAGAARAVPRGLRDRLYRSVARNRYRLFGRRETCWAPKADWKDRML